MTVNRLEIVQATYGSVLLQCCVARDDVTAQVAALVDQQRQTLTIPKDRRLNDIFEDTMPGQAKVLTVSYKYNGALQPTARLHEVAHYYDWVLPRTYTSTAKEEEKGLRIVSASWGAGEKTMDVTTVLAGMVDNNCLFIRAKTPLAKLLGDPAPRQRKELILKYKVNGEAQEETVAEWRKTDLSISA